MKPHIRNQIFNFWSENWTSLPYNKFKNIGVTVAKKYFNNFLFRIDEIKFTRVRLGHTRLTHSYHFTGDQAPVCDVCNCVYSIRHILRLCPRFRIQRKLHFGKFVLSTNTIKEFLDRKNTNKNKSVINFLKATNLFTEI